MNRVKMIKQWFLASDKRKAGLMLFAMLLLILLTRLIAMRHEMTLHGDEAFFINSASSVFKEDYSFKLVKDYPNGALVFQMPFQFVGKIKEVTSPDGWGEREWGRLASIFYFSAACVMGGIILWRNFGRKPVAVFFYALIMTFSLFQIEQSRYGTGDAISFFVLMAILYVLDLFFKESHYSYLYSAAFFTGVMAAIKFPLFFFIIYPICASLIKLKQLGTKESPLRFVGGIFIFALAGLLLFSPQWFVDRAFFMKAFFEELGTYVAGGRPLYVDSPDNHFAYLMIYQLLYADFPLAPLFAVFGAVCLYHKNKKHGFTSAFYTLALPASIIVFFFYNLFTTELALRTYYPYFCLCVFFTSYALSELFSYKKFRIAIIALAVLMVCRGGFFIYTLTKEPRGQYIIDTLTQHEKWEQRKMIVTFGSSYISGKAEVPQRRFGYRANAFLYGNPQLWPGEFGVTEGIEHGMTKRSIFRKGTEKEQWRAGWVDFRERNRDYVIGVSYPPYYHYIFGGWISGSTLGVYEFPINYIYYRPDELGKNAGNPQKYHSLYAINEWREYLETIARLDCTVVLGSSPGMPYDFVAEVYALLSVDFDTPLLADNYGVLVLESAKAEERVVFSQYSEGAIVMSLTETIGTPFDIYVAADANSATVSGRYYLTSATGFNIIVYDREMQRVMDWRSLVFDAGDGSIALYK